MTAESAGRQTLTQLDVEGLLERVATEEPTPGGGSVSSLAGALGASLNAMVWRLTRSKGVVDPPGHELAVYLQEMEDLGSALAANVDADAASYEGVIAALRLPKDGEEQKAARRAAIEAATKTATDVPLETARLCARLMELSLAAARLGFSGAVTDAGVGLLMGFAGLNGALYNVEINLVGLPAGPYVEAVAAEVAALREEAHELLARGDAEVRRRLAE
jgi:formiminotetrahydrofolate cyclodeaminase